MSTYLVELTVIGDFLEEQTISREIGIEATRFFRKGQEKAPGTVWKQSVWSLEVLPTGGGEWLSLDEGLACLIGKLSPAQPALARIAEQWDVAISCGHFYSVFGAGPTLSPEILGSLAQVRVKLRISNYWSNEELHENSQAATGKSWR